MANKAISTLTVGSSVYLNVGGVRKEFLVVHQGLPSSLYDASCDGTWLLMKDCYTNRAWSDYSSNNYKIAAINTYLNGPFLGLFDSNIQGIIKQVKIPYVNGTGGAAIASGANGLSCKVFLLGGCEVGLSSIGNVPSDGVKLDYFDSTVSTDTKRVANLNGSPIGWALRSADSNTSNTIWFITVRGSANNYQSYANGSFGIRPALVLPSTTLVDDSGNVVTVDLTAHKTLVNGTAYTVKGGKCMVGGTVYNILKGRTLIGGTGYDITFAPPYDPVFANNTWEQIVAACHNNEVPDTWKVADQKPMTINGVDYQIDIIGKNHDTYSDGSGKAPLTFQLHDCYGETKNMNSSNTNNGGWTSCAMRSTHLPAILALMPTEVQNGIREVNKLTSAGNRSATINTTADKLFLLSEIEIFGSVRHSKSGEGTQYDYYKAGKSKMKKLNGSVYHWYERSPDGSSSLPFCYVDSSGNASSSYSDFARGVAFGFCF